MHTVDLFLLFIGAKRVFPFFFSFLNISARESLFSEINNQNYLNYHKIPDDIIYRHNNVDNGVL